MGRTIRPIWAVGLLVSIMLLGACSDGNVGKARHYQEEGDYGQAISHYRLALEKDPENRSARYSLVESYVQQLMETPKEEITAEMVEKTMIELRPAAEPLMDDVNIKRYISMIYQLLARRYAEQGMNEKAAESWVEVTKIEPSLEEGHYNLGVALTKQEKFEEALPHLEKSISVNPYFIKGYYAVGNALVALERYEEAVGYYQKALEISPDDVEVRHNLGVAYSHTGKAEKAIEELEKTIELQPGFFLAYTSLSLMYKNMGDTEKVADVDKRWADYAKTHIKTSEEKQPQETPTGG